MALTRALLPLSLAFALTLTACGGGDGAASEEEAAETEGPPSAQPSEEEDDDRPWFDMPQDCESAGATDVALDHLPEDAELVTEEETGDEEEPSFRCLYGSRAGQNGITLVYSEGITLADMLDIGEQYEEAGEAQDRDLYMTDRVEDLGGVLETTDEGDVDGHSTTIHLPGGVFIWGMSIGSDIDDALPEDQLDEVLADAAEALL